MEEHDIFRDPRVFFHHVLLNLYVNQILVLPKWMYASLGKLLVVIHVAQNSCFKK